MGLLDAVKGLLGGGGVGELLEQTGIGEHLGAAGDLVQQPVEEFGAQAAEVGEQFGAVADVAQAPAEELGAQAADLTDVAGVTDQLP
ncbi:MAG TPA: hypothetical protein VHK88_02105 [Aquihabitans sp.]|jgi:hypothetical protein|nr:hypothetical protein [Aquihabitans sp.]